MTDLVVERASANDVADVARLYNRYVRESTATFHCRTISDEEMSALLLRPPPHGGYVARRKSDQALLGYLSLAPFIDRCAARCSVELAIYLAADACGRGIGGTLLRQGEEVARGHGIQTVVAVISTENAGSCRFFRRHGYHHCGTVEMVARKFGRRLGVEYFQKIIVRRPNADDEGQL